MSRPRVVLTSSSYRLVATHYSNTVVETRDGKDELGVQRWRTIETPVACNQFRAIIHDVRRALDLREKRARARRKK